MSKLRLAIVELTAADRAELESLAIRRKTAQALALRANPQITSSRPSSASVAEICLNELQVQDTSDLLESEFRSSLATFCGELQIRVTRLRTRR